MSTIDSLQTPTFDAAASVATLMDAWTSGRLLSDLPAGEKPVTLNQGYAAQALLFAAAKGEPAGWKLGVGSPAAMRAGQLTRPLIGKLDRARIHAGGTHIVLPSDDPVTVECEIAFVLAQDIAPESGRRLQASDVRHLCVTFEIVRSRFVDRRAVGWPAFVADNVGFEALVVSPALGAGLDLDLIAAINASAVVTVNSEDKARALHGEAATSALDAMNALLAHAAQYNITLRAGELVTTGAMCQPFDLRGTGHDVAVTFLDQSLRFSL